VAASERPSFSLADAAVLLAAAGAWLVARPYAGLVHDARLYALQALGRLHPESLGQDVFLRFGSQDSYSLFSPLYAAFIASLGVENAARWLTLFGHVWWFAAAGWLATRILGRRRGLLALALIAALPGYYSAWDVFRYAEPFLTARLFAEAATLTGLALLAHRHLVGSVVLMSMAMLLHPLIGVAGMLFWAASVIPRRWRPALVAAVVTGTVSAVAVAWWHPVFPVMAFDDDWLGHVRQRSPFLFLADWNADAFRQVLVPLAALWALPRTVRRKDGDILFDSAVMVGGLGLIVTLIGADVGKVVLVTQGQAWRWTWLPTVLAVLAVVRYAPDAWRRDSTGRAGLVLLALAWLLIGWPAVVIGLLAALVLVYGPSFRHSFQRPVFLLALAAGSAGALATTLLAIGGGALDMADTDSTVVDAIVDLLRHGGIPIALLVIFIYWTATRHAVAALGIACCLAVLSLAHAIPRQASRQFVVADVDALESWQKAIPAGAEVLWPDDTTACWVVLQRRSFVSALQTSGILFSPTAFREIEARVAQASLVLPPAFAFRASAEGMFWPPTELTLTETCRRSGTDFIVSAKPLGLREAARPLVLANERTHALARQHLYRCADFRQD
jgi:hypothetical protein